MFSRYLSFSRINGRRKICKFLAAIAIPLIALTMDIWVSPIVFSERLEKTAVLLSDALDYGPIYVGRHRGNDIFVTTGDLAELDETFRVAPRPSGLAVSVYVDFEEVGGEPGALLSTVLEQLHARSPAAYTKVAEALRRLRGDSEGAAFVVPLGDSSAARGLGLPDQLVVIVLPRVEPGKALPSGLRRGMEAAGRQGLASITVPIMAVTWEDSVQNGSVALVDYFNALFGSLPASRTGMDVVVSLYRNWPTWQLETAIAAFNGRWEEMADAVHGPGIQHYSLRIPLVLIILCFAACGVVGQLTLARLIIISTSFVGASGTKEVYEAFASAYVDQAWIIQTLLLMALTLGFPAYYWVRRGLPE